MRLLLPHVDISVPGIGQAIPGIARLELDDEVRLTHYQWQEVTMSRRRDAQPLLSSRGAVKV